MNFLVATALTQGEKAGDYHWCVEGELLWIQEPCGTDRRDREMPCGCGRGFSGVSSRVGNTTARVADVELSREELVAALEASLEQGGWPPIWAAELIDDMIELAAEWPVGAIIDRHLDISTASVRAPILPQADRPGSAANRSRRHRRLADRVPRAGVPGSRRPLHSVQGEPAEIVAQKTPRHE